MEKYIVILLFISVSFISCNKEEDLGESGLLPINVEKSALDEYLEDTFSDPYNMIIDYKWAGNEVNINKTLLPVQLEKVAPFCDLLHKLWIEPYELHVSGEFVKKYIPKQVVLVGSHNLNSDGTNTYGIAEAGRKITLFSINHVDIKSKKVVLAEFSTLHHEFAHILHQTKNYDPSYKIITPDGYTSTWYDSSNKDARAKGFVTAYAMENPDEDFVEMIAHLIILTPSEWTDMLSEAGTDGAILIQLKEQKVAQYLSQKWNINIYELRDLVQQRLNEILE